MRNSPGESDQHQVSNKQKNIFLINYHGYLIYVTQKTDLTTTSKGNQDQNGRKQPYLWYHFFREENQSKQLYNQHDTESFQHKKSDR